jgi:hypothetical protein
MAWEIITVQVVGPVKGRENIFVNKFGNMVPIVFPFVRRAGEVNPRAIYRDIPDSGNWYAQAFHTDRPPVAQMLRACGRTGTV